MRKRNALGGARQAAVIQMECARRVLTANAMILWRRVRRATAYAVGKDALVSSATILMSRVRRNAAFRRVLRCTRVKQKRTAAATAVLVAEERKQCRHRRRRQHSASPS